MDVPQWVLWTEKGQAGKLLLPPMDAWPCVDGRVAGVNNAELHAAKGWLVPVRHTGVAHGTARSKPERHHYCKRLPRQ
jgi:hypothetical protein